MKKYPLVTIIILNWNQAEMTIECLKSLEKTTYPNYQIVIVDNGSSDQSETRIHSIYPEINIIQNIENVGYSEGNNIGMRYAFRSDSQYIFLLNNDTIIDPGMLENLVECSESDPQIGIVGPTMYYANPSDTLWAGENRIEWKYMRINKIGMGKMISRAYLETLNPIDVDYIDSCALLIKRTVLENIGLLDPNYFIFFDDADLNVRAFQHGYRIIYIPKAFIWHKVSASMGIISPATSYYYTRNSLLFYMKYTKGYRKWIVFLSFMIKTLRTLAAWSFKREYKTILYRKKRMATSMAIRDYFLKRFGKMGHDVIKVCYGN